MSFNFHHFLPQLALLCSLLLKNIFYNVFSFFRKTKISLSSSFTKTLGSNMKTLQGLSVF